MDSLAGRTALISGSCGEGMGRSIALRLARDGANIVLNYGTYRRGAEAEARAKQIAEAIASLGSRAIIHEANTTVEAEVVAMVTAAEAAFGAVDILVNNAGGDWQIGDYTKIPLAHWRAVLAAEIDGAFLLMKHVVPGMRQRRWGRVIHLSMERSLQFGSTKGVAPDYCLGKAARAWMTNAFGHDELAHGITMNCLEPGIIEHLGFEEALAMARGDSDRWAQRTGPSAHDAAEIVAFLCSEAGRFVSTSAIRVLNP